MDRKTTVDRDAAILLADAAEAAGVGRYVMVSAMGADRRNAAEVDDPVFAAYLDAKAAADEAVRARPGLQSTIVRPGLLTDEPATGRVRVAESTGRGSIPRADVAALLVGLLDVPATGGVTFELVSGDATVVLHLTEWDEFRHMHPSHLTDIVNQKKIVDGRNVLDRELWRTEGWTYRALGRI